MNRFLFVLLSATLLACNEPREFYSHAEENLHPRPEFYPPLGYEPKGNDWVDRLDQPEEAFYSMQTREELYRADFDISRWGEEQDVLLSRFTDAAFVGKWIVVLDSGPTDLKIMNTESGEVETIGRAGQGPLEFLGPRSIDPVDDNSFIVWDGNRSVKTISYEDGQWVEENVVQVPVSPEGGCMFDNRMVLLGLHMTEESSHALHVVDGEGNLERSFGEAYTHKSGLVSQGSSRVSGIACFPELDRIVYAYTSMPMIMAYDFEGNLEWVRYIDGFLPPAYRHEGTSMRYGQPATGTNYLWGLRRVEGTETFVVQLSQTTGSRPDVALSLMETFIFDAEGGEVVEQTMLPRVTRPGLDRFIAYTSDGGPTVLEFRRKSTEEID